MFIKESWRAFQDLLQNRKKKKKNFDFQNALAELADRRANEIFESSEVVVEENLRASIFRKMYRILEDLSKSQFFLNDVGIVIYPLNLFSQDNEVSVHFSSYDVFIKLEYLEKKNKIILRAGQEPSYTYDKFRFKKEFKVDDQDFWITQVQMTIVEVLDEERYKSKQSRVRKNN